VADDRKFLLEVPVDAAQIAELKPDHAVKVVAYNKKGIVAERVVKLGSKGKATASFGFAESPGSLQVALGPETATAADLKNPQNRSARR
jgi:hypothetical protein